MVFKKLFVSIIFLFSAILFAQENKTLLGPGKISHSGYGALEIKLSNFSNDNAVYAGGKGAWLINNTILIGGGGYGLVTNHVINFYNNDEHLPNSVNAFNAYGGIIVGYIYNQNSLIHFSSEVFIGSGNVYYKYRNDANYEDNDQIISESTYFVFEPSLFVELNVTDFMVVGIGGGYRFCDDIDMLYNIGINLSGFSGNFVVKFGKF